MMAPIAGPSRYTQMSPNSPDTIAGASERAGLTPALVNPMPVRWTARRANPMARNLVYDENFDATRITITKTAVRIASPTTPLKASRPPRALAVVSTAALLAREARARVGGG